MYVARERRCVGRGSTGKLGSIFSPLCTVVGSETQIVSVTNIVSTGNKQDFVGFDLFGAWVWSAPGTLALRAEQQGGVGISGLEKAVPHMDGKPGGHWRQQARPTPLRALPQLPSPPRRNRT